MTVGSPVTVKLQCPTEHEQWLQNLERRIKELERMVHRPQGFIDTTAIERDLADLRKKVGYLEEDLRKHKFLETYHQPTWTTRR